MKDLIIFQPLNMVGFNQDLLYDLLPSIIHYAIRGERALFSYAVDIVCERIIDSDLAYAEEVSIRQQCENYLNIFSVRLMESMTEQSVNELRKWLVTDPIEVDIVSPTEIIMQVTHER